LSEAIFAACPNAKWVMKQKMSSVIFFMIF